MTNELPAGQVTIADLYRELTGMRTDMASALMKLSVIDDRATINGQTLSDHEMRIRNLEKFRYTLAGLSVVGGILAGAIGYWVGHLVH